MLVEENLEISVEPNRGWDPRIKCIKCGDLVRSYLIKTDRWEAVPLDRLRVGLAPQRDGRLMLGFSAGF